MSRPPSGSAGVGRRDMCGDRSGAPMLLLLALPALAQDIPFERYELANGLQVILHPDHSLPQVVVERE